MDKHVKVFFQSIVMFTVGAMVLFPIVDFAMGKEVNFATIVESFIFGIFIGAIMGALEYIKSKRADKQ